VTVAIRPARSADAAGLAEIARAAYAPYAGDLGFEPPPMRQDFPADIAAGAVWMCDGGYVVARAKGADWLIENVGVAPGRQGRGAGRALIAFAEAEGRRRGFARVVLYTHARMARPLALYPRLGYVETARRTENGLDRVYFAKRLAPGEGG
jgi:GNAT superfamily N-acetyltransferase